MLRTLKVALTAPVLIVSTLLPFGIVHAGGPSSFCDSTGTPVAGFTASPGMDGVGSLTITFDGTTDTEACSGTITGYSWDLGDGTTATGATVTHTYSVGTWHPILTVTNSAGLTDSSPATADPVVVKASNAAPVLGDDTAEVPQGVETVIPAGANDSDPDGDTLQQWQVATNPAHGAVVASDASGNFTYVSDSNYAGPDSFTYSVSDGFGGVSTATVNITVDPHVVAQDDYATTPETTAITIPVLNNDSAVDGDPLTVTSVFKQSGGGTAAVSADGQSIVYTPSSDWAGTVHLYYYVADANESWFTATANVTVDVTSVNHAPVALGGSYSAPEDTPISGNVMSFATDPDGDTLTAQAVTQPQNGTLSLNSDGTFTYVPNPGYFGVDNFQYQVTDPSGATSGTAYIALDVNFVNHAPVTASDNLTTAEDTTGSVYVIGNDTDPDGDVIYLTGIASNPAHGTATFNSNGTVSYTPAANYNGSDSFTYQVTDSHGATSTGTVNVTVTPVNDPPVASFSWTTASRTINLTATASDIDGSVVNYTWHFGDSTTASSTSPTMQHSYKKRGTYLVTLIVTDDQGGQTTVQQTVSL